MKIYRVHLEHPLGESEGYRYFSNRKDAEKEMREWLKQNEEVEDGGALAETYMQEFEFEISKDGMLKALNKLGSHPDNG